MPDVEPIVLEDEPKFTVLIPVRNEAHSIGDLLSDLEAQDYDKSNYEVLVVDDASTDDLSEVISSLKNKLSMTIMLLSLPSGSGKKAAVTYGVSKASMDLIICTDGDCRIGKSWLRLYAQSFETTKAKMVFGPVLMSFKTAFEKLQAIDFGGLIGYGSSTLELGFPSTCNAANMAYEKLVFNEVGGYEGNEEIPTGDDEFLLQKISKQFPGQIHFLKSRDAIVRTKPKDSLGSFFQQRIRWVSKWKYNLNRVIRLSSVFVFIDFGSVLIVPFFLQSAWEWKLLALTISLRWLAELVYLLRTSRFFQISRPYSYILFLSIIYPAYAFLIGIASIFGRYSWKGRKY